MLSVPLLVTASLTMPPVTAVVPEPLTPRVDRLPVVFRLPVPLVVVAPTTIPPALMVAMPPDIPRLPVMLPTLVSVPLVCNTFVAVPPVRFADPPLTVRAWSDALAVRFPELETVVVPPTIPPLLIVVVPPERLANPVMFATLVTVPFDCVRFVVVLPVVRFTVPPETVI